MKDALISIIILLVIISFLIINAVIIDKYTSELLLIVSDMSDNPVLEEENAREIIEIWDKIVAFISISVTHQEIENVDRCAGQVLSYCETDNQSEFIASKRGLRQALEHISFSGALSLDTLF